MSPTVLLTDSLSRVWVVTWQWSGHTEEDSLWRPQPPSSQYPFYTKKTEFEAEPPKSFGVYTLFKEKDFVDLPEAEYLTGNVSLFHEEQWRQQGGFKKKSRGERQIFSFSQITRYFYALLIVLQKLCYVMLCSIYLHLSILYYTTRQMYSIWLWMLIFLKCKSIQKIYILSFV